ncbi:MAG: hypothetical protein ACR2PT_22755 [Endozoicomonas sp.]
MSLEARVEMLESKHAALDADVHSLARVVADIKNLVLEHQKENRERFDLQDHEIAGLKTCVSALAEATLAGFKRVDEEQAATRNDIAALELLIRQRFPQS